MSGPVNAMPTPEEHQESGSTVEGSTTKRSGAEASDVEAASPKKNPDARMDARLDRWSNELDGDKWMRRGATITGSAGAVAIVWGIAWAAVGNRPVAFSGVVLVAGSLAVLGSVLRLAAHGHKQRGNLDGLGKVLAYSAALFSFVGALTYLISQQP